MQKKISIKVMQYLMAPALCLLIINCVGPLGGEEIKFLTSNVYEDLSPKAARIEIITEKSGWTFTHVQYNDTIAYLPSGGIY